MSEPLNIATSNRLFVELRSYGQCDPKGKKILACGFKGKFIAEPDKPITTLILPLLSELLSMAKFDDPANREPELKALKDYVAGLAVVNRPLPHPSSASPSAAEVGNG